MWHVCRLPGAARRLGPVKGPLMLLGCNMCRGKSKKGPTFERLLLPEYISNDICK